MMPLDDDPRDCDKAVYAFDAPAFMRRARAVDDAWTGLLDACRNARTRLLEMPRMRLARLFALGQLALKPAPAICSADDLAYLRELFQQWQPQLKAAVKPARSAGELERASADLARSFQRFNERWAKHLHDVELGIINRLRDGYNRYYPLEKECALWSSRIAQVGFKPLKPVTIDDLLEVFPLLRIPCRS